MRYASILAFLLLFGCTPTLSGADATGGVVHTKLGSQSDALTRARKHCRQYGKTAVVTDNDAFLAGTMTFKCVQDGEDE